MLSSAYSLAVATLLRFVFVLGSLLDNHAAVDDIPFRDVCLLFFLFLLLLFRPPHPPLVVVVLVSALEREEKNQRARVFDENESEKIDPKAFVVEIKY